MALGKLFTLSGKTIIPKEDCYIIKPIANMMEAYPEDHLKLVAYLHYMCSMKKEDNPYADVPDSDREEQIIKDLELFNVDLESPIILKALECVKEKYFTTFYGIYIGIKAVLDNMGKELRIIKPDFNSKDGNANAIIAFTKNYEVLNKSFKAAYRDFDEETGNVRVRGGGKLAYDEDDYDN